MTLVNDKTYQKLQYITADNIHSPNVTAIFTTRNGGVSGTTPDSEYYRSLNMRLDSEKDSQTNVTENYRIVTSSQGFTADGVLSLNQKHNDSIIVVDEDIIKSRTDPVIGEADAMLTNIRGVMLSIRIADCVPILLYDSANGVIGAVHAGWHGSYKQIVAKAVRLMKERYGIDLNNIQAAIGPAIGVCCYEVGTDLYERFQKELGGKTDRFFKVEPGKKPFLDLKEMNKSFLIEAGIPERNIEVSELCTMCNPELFYSHRRSGEKRGTMAALIGMR